MKYLFFVSILVLSFKSFAQSCGSLQEGEVIRLDDKNKSLENFKVQDQDGLGSCYANAASLLLQGSLQGNPELSYIHLATLYSSEKLADRRSALKAGDDFDIYAQQTKKKQKAINGGGEAMEWDLALDGGITCGVIKTVKDLEAKSKKPVICKKADMNFEKILESGDGEHKQFKTILQSSVYMNQFQKTFGDLNEKPTWFTKKRILASQKKYKDFKDSFQALLETKKKKLEEIECKKISTSSLGPVIEPMKQVALSYQSCFDPGHINRSSYWCKAILGVVGDAKVNGNGTFDEGETSNEWIKIFQLKIQQRKSNFSSEGLSDDLANSLVESLALDGVNKLVAAKFIKETLINKTLVSKNLDDLSKEYNEVNEKGFSDDCVTRNTYNYFETKEYENDWKNNEGLCTYADLMKQAGNVVVRYKGTGLNDLKAVMAFLVTDAGNTYDAGLMTLYAADCEDKGKFSIPQNIECASMSVKDASKEKINNKLIEKLKANRPLTASICAQILKKPRSQFAENECGHHALGITGIRCIDGKLNYMIQNSWGAKNKAGKNSVGIENIDGKGAYWFDEQAFFDSVYSIDYIN